MGKKGKRGMQGDDDLPGQTQERTFQSHKEVLAREAREADKGRSKHANQRAAGSDSDDEQMGGQKQKRHRQGVAQEDADFGEESKTIPEGDDVQGDLEAHFEGVAKKNTRKKKQKEANIYGGGGDELAGAFDEGADSDEVYAKKGGKHNKKDKQQGKKKNRKQDSDAEEEELKQEATAEPEPQQGEFPLTVVYCQSKFLFVISPTISTQSAAFLPSTARKGRKTSKSVKSGFSNHIQICTENSMENQSLLKATKSTLLQQPRKRKTKNQRRKR
jgi:hypothetical protein